MRYVVRPPSPPLAPFVEHLWHFEGELAHARERVLPSGQLQLLVNLHEDELRWYDGAGYATAHRGGGAALCGAFTHHFAIDTAEQRHICGVNFKPGGAAPFVRPPVGALEGTHVAAGDLWGRDGATLRERLCEAPIAAAALARLDAFLVARAVRPLAPDPAVAFAVGALDRGAPVAAVGDRLGLAPARLIRRFAAAVGLPPKRFARLRRFNRVLVAAPAGRGVDWARVAVDCGYYDQAHLIHEFRAFSGLAPTAYRPRAPGELRHVRLDG
jgi:AraC-like DNA-binding protein